MKFKLVYIIILFFLIPQSCIKRNNTKITKTQTEIKLDTIVIKISGMELPYYYSVDGYIDSLSRHPIFVGYNHFYHSFDLFDLMDKRLIKKIQLEQRGPNGIPLNGIFKILSKNTIFIRNRDMLFNIDSNGKVIERINLFNILQNTKYLFSREGITFAYPSNNLTLNSKELFSYIIPKDYSFWEKSFYKEPIFAIINFKNKNVRFLNITYPKEANSDKIYGELLKPYTLIVDSDLIFNFPFSSKIYNYNLISKKLSIHNVESKFIKNICSPISKKIDKNMSRKEMDSILSNHLYSNEHFHKVVYDPYKNVFYQVNSNKPVKKNGKNIVDYYLSIFDRNFKKITEFKLDNNLYTSSYFVTREGLTFQIINNHNIEDIDKLKLIRIKVKF